MSGHHANNYSRSSKRMRLDDDHSTSIMENVAQAVMVDGDDSANNNNNTASASSGAQQQQYCVPITEQQQQTETTTTAAAAAAEEFTPLSIEPCTMKKVQEHITQLETELEEYTKLKRSEIQNAKGRLAHLKCKSQQIYRNRKRCSVQGCTQAAHSHGVCRSHGVKTICTFECLDTGERCTTYAQANGLCKKHGARKKYVCSADGCVNILARKSYGVCPEHGGEVPKKFIHKKCSVEGCTNFRQKGAVCTRHGGRGRKNCRVEGCTKLAVLHGICVAHGGVHKCSHDGCNKNADRGGTCINHSFPLGIECIYEGCDNGAKTDDGYCGMHRPRRIGDRSKKCNQDGCVKYAVVKGLCAEHSETGCYDKQCKYGGCKNQAKTNAGYCGRHGTDDKEKQCRKEGCERIAQNRGMKGVCTEHRGMRNIDTECKQEGCTHEAKTDGGYCGRHGTNDKARQCEYDGCERIARSRGKCADHEGTPKCIEDGCEKIAYARGKCAKHFRNDTGCKHECIYGGCTHQAKTDDGYCGKHGPNTVGDRSKKCNQDGCEKNAALKGFCVEHSGTLTVCKYEWCKNQAKTDAGYCNRHGTNDKERQCMKEGCERIATRKGVCAEHGTIEQCRYGGCKKIAQKKGVCAEHGTNDMARVREVRQCRYEGCEKYARTKGVCAEHVEKCSHDGCNKEAQTGGTCTNHRFSWKVECIYSGCTNQAKTDDGYCDKHGPNSAGSRSKKCSHDGCSKQAQAGGTCFKHTTRVECTVECTTLAQSTSGFCVKHQRKIW